MSILFDEKHCCWALQGSDATYGLRVDEEGHLRHLYHGPLLHGVEHLPQFVIVLQDPAYPLRVRLYYRLFEDHDLMERYAACG